MTWNSYLRPQRCLTLGVALLLLGCTHHLSASNALDTPKAPALANQPLVVAEPPRAAAPGVILVFEEHLRSMSTDGDIDLGAQKLSIHGERDWDAWTHGSDNRSIANSDQLDQNAATLSDGTGGIFVVFEATPQHGEHRGDVDLYGQHINADGKLLWNNGQPLPLATSRQRERNPVLSSDGQGGLIIVFEIEIVQGPDKGDIDIGAQRIDARGNMLWNDGMRSMGIARTKLIEKNPNVVTAPDGHVVIVYETVQRGALETGHDLLARKVNLDGEPQWGKRGIVPVAHSSGDDINPYLAAANDGVVVAFEQHFDTERGYDVDVVVQKLSWDGRLVWLGGEASIPIANSSHLERNPRVIATQDGGHAIAFEVSLTRGEFAGDSDLFIQKVAADGTLMWTETELGTIVSASKSMELNPEISPAPDGGVFVFWEHHIVDGSHVGDVDILGQRIGKDGARLWNAGTSSVLVAASQQLELSPQAIDDSEGGAIVVFETESLEYKWRGLRHLRGQRVDSNGVLMWNQGKHSSLVAGSRDSEINAVLPGKRRPTFRRHDRSPRTKPPSSAPSDAL